MVKDYFNVSEDKVMIFLIVDLIVFICIDLMVVEFECLLDVKVILFFG